MSIIDDAAAQAAAKAKYAQTQKTYSPQGGSVQDMDLDVFLNLMLTELQNQDPLNPMDNQEMLNTMGQIREISASDKLTSTLDSVLLGQSVATSAGLIGKEVEGLTDEGQRVVGQVQQVSINDGAPVLDLAVETSAEAGTNEGKVAAGTYQYEIVWETDDGVFSVQTEVDTEELGEDFQGSIRLRNLPPLNADVVRKVYRTDGSGDPRLVGTLPNGRTTGFTDEKATSELGADTLTGPRSVLAYGESVKVKLSNISGIQRLEQ
jgi:flagellar basal-body rod modification protein FlgD